MLRLAPAIAIAVLAGPILFGIGATLFPAFGYFPVLGRSTLSLAPWADLLASPGLLRSCLVSLGAGLAASAAALALTVAFVAGWWHSRLFGPLQHLVSPLLSVPHAAAAFGLAFLLMPSGWLMRLVSPELTGYTRPPDWLVVHDPFGLAMTTGLFVKEFPFLLLVTLAALPQARSRETAMVAMGLGYGRMAAFIHGPWPLIYRQVRLAVFAVIAYSTSVVDVALILGPTNPPVLAVRLVTWMNDPELGMRFKASAGAMLQLGLTGSALLLWIAGERAAAAVVRRVRGSGRRFARDRLLRLAAIVLVAASALSVFAGLALLALWSFAGYWTFPDAFPGSLSLQNWERQADALGKPFLNTLAIGVSAVAAALVLTLGCLESEARDGRTGVSRALALIYLPLIVPQASFVFGLQLFFLWLGSSSRLPELVLVHLTFVLPYVVLSLSSPWRAWDGRYAMAARSLGASRNRVFWRVRTPMLLRPILVACAVGFAVSVGQYLPTLLVGAGRWPTITTEAVALASGGNRRIIGIYTFLQMALPFVGFAVAMAVPALAFRRRRDMRIAP